MREESEDANEGQKGEPEENKEEEGKEDGGDEEAGEENDQTADYEDVGFDPIADMGTLYGTLPTCLSSLRQWLNPKGWDEINLMFELEEYYLCDYNQENIDRLSSMLDYHWKWRLAKTEDPKIFVPIELLDIVYDEDGVIFFKNHNINKKK